MNFLFGIFIGVFLVIAFLQYRKYVIREHHNKIFQEILSLIAADDTKFVSRINSVVEISMNTSIGHCSIIYVIDRMEITLFRNRDAIYTGELCDPKIIKSISKSIWERFSNNINSVQRIGPGQFMDRDSYLRATGKYVGTTTPISKASEFNIDEILDKISDTGYESLSDEEKDFLKNQK